MPAIIITRATATHTSSSNATSGSGTHKEYRVELEERRRRTVFVSSDVPPEQWQTQHILDIADISKEQREGHPVIHETDTETHYSANDSSEGDASNQNSATVHRSKSLSERHIITIGDSPTRSRSAQDGKSHNGGSSSRYQSRRVSLRPDDANNTAAALKRMSVSPASPTTPPNSPAVWKHRGPNPMSKFGFSHNANTNPASLAMTVVSRPQILFYHKHNPHYGFTNFSAHPVMYKGKKYPTSEHLFQSFKFQGHRPDIAEHIRTCNQRPSVAFAEARRFQASVRPDWKSINVEKMDETIYHKFTQHSDLLQELLGTGNAELVEDSDKDAFWGIGADGRGRNELGKALERLRTQLRGD